VFVDRALVFRGELRRASGILDDAEQHTEVRAQCLIVSW
jgi:hypothetical protein